MTTQVAGRAAVITMITDTVADYVALAIQLAVTVLLLSLLTYVSCVVHSLRTIVSRDTLMTACITLSCLLWMWSSFVSDLHLSLLLALTRWGCTLWDWWMQYAFGLNLVFTFIIVKLNWYRLIHEHQRSSHIRRQTLALVVLCMLPILIVCAGVEYNNGSRIDKSSGICRSKDAWKYALIGTLLINYVGLLYLIYRGMRYKYTQRAHKELLYGSILASLALLTILALNLTHQTVLVYGRVLKCICVNVTCLSLFGGLIGVPIIHSLKTRNEYEMLAAVKDTEIQHSSQLRCVADLLPYKNAYTHYLNWIQQRYINNPHKLSMASSTLSTLVVPKHQEDRVMSFEMYVTLCENDPQMFLFYPLHMVRFIQRLDIALDSSRSPDLDWKRNIEACFIQQSAKMHVILPHKLRLALFDSSTDEGCNFKDLLLCTKLWLLAQLEVLTWSDYIQDKELGLPAWIRTLNDVETRRYLLDSI